MEVLAFGDAHIKPTGDAVDYDSLTVPASVDAIIVAGDVVHRTDAESLDTGHEFLARLDAADPPVFCVPGNHDPLPAYDTLLDGLDATLVHETHATIETDDETLTVVGWGLETTTFAPEIELTQFPALDPGDGTESDQYALDQASSTLEDVAYDLLVENDAESPREQAREAADRLGIERANRPTFAQQWNHLRTAYQRLSTLFGAPTDPTLVVTHVPPYNTALDEHHSIGTRERDLDGYHVGSIALTLALREHTPFAALSGHSHRERYEVEPTHLLGLGFQVIASVDLDLQRGAFGYRYLHH
ncbi:metallophosphoesterase (plasmid) [Halarchaeum sp. CBA1220]|uniref:metallophosphoesterase family protein n=1 Tax=Halarchaeum sp. CBA1220 TaxID=1853682 RepID=UPI000F3A8AD8|nr:metallophosphoesterase [Halarchaeum sp. CBA1220]QLC35556.1 metallophosphoesterase [Halarchaeum sp. CBA1220]